MSRVINYVVQDKKTRCFDPETNQEYRLISGQNCVAETAYQEFMATKIQYGKDNGVFYKQFVQSFKPEEATTPKEIHQMGLELAEYFKGFEVLVATHIDEDHWHNHLIVNSVNAETGLKIQFNERNFNELRRYSDEICQAHGLETLKPYKKDSPVAGMNTREYRTAEKGNSWKFKLMNAIDSAIGISITKGDFIANMERMGYGVKWVEHHKYITYITPESQKCRDNRLHEEKYLKERMEKFYEYGKIQDIEQAGKPAGRVPNQSAVIRNPAGGVQQAGVYDDGNRETPSAHAGENRQSAHMGGLEEGHHAGGGNSYERPLTGRPSLRKRFEAGVQQPNRDGNRRSDRSFWKENFKTGKDASGTGFDPVESPLEVDGHRGGGAGSVIGAAVAVENLLFVNDRPEEEKKPEQAIEHKTPQKKKQARSYDRGMGM